MKKILFVVLIALIFPQFIQAQDKETSFKEIVRISASPVKNQQKTGTCWSYATTSFLESEILRKGKGEYDLSEMFFVRNVYLQKAKNYLLYHGYSNFGEGGQAHDVLNAIRVSGIVPQSNYSGNPQTPGIYDHRKLEEELAKSISKINSSFNEKKALVWEEKFNQLLDDNFGKIPIEFGLKGQNYSPIGFVDFLDIDPDDYVELMSFSSYPFYTTVDLQIPDNWSHDRYINVPIEDLVQIMDSSLYKGYSICWDGDTSEKGFEHRKGMATLPRGEDVSELARQLSFYNRKTTDDHLMHIIGISENEEGEVFYLTKNSWGTENSEFGGYLYISVPYIKLKTVAILVHKNAIPLEILNKINKL